MDSALREVNASLSQAIAKFQTTFAEELQGNHAIPESGQQIFENSKELNTAIENLHQLQDLLTPPLHKLIDGIFAFTTSSALRAAVQYNIADILAKTGPLSTQQLAEEAKGAPDAIGPLLHLLAGGPGIFHFDRGTGQWTNNEASSLLLRDHWTQWWRWASLYTDQFYTMIGNLPAAAAESEPRTAMHITYDAEADAPLYRVLGALPWVKDFHATLGAGAKAMSPGLMADYPWQELGDTTVCDLGGGNGEFLATLLKAYPNINGAILELEATAKMAKQNLEGPEKGLESRIVEIHEGDFFQSIPAYPVYTIKWTLHNWDDAKSEQILRNVRSAMTASPENRLLVIDSVVFPGERLSTPALYGSVIMSAGSKGGKERTEAEWESLAQRSGWNIHKVYHIRGCIPCIIDLR